MSNLEVLRALQDILQVELPDTFVYPNDYKNMDVRIEPPFVVIEELPAVVNTTDGQFRWDEWTIALYCFVSDGNDSGLEVPSLLEAEARELIFPLRDAIKTLLKNNKTINGTVQRMGNDDSMFTHSVGALTWNKRPLLGLMFSITVMTAEDGASC